jgi:hypothetical protein
MTWVVACFCGAVFRGTACPKCGRCALPRQRPATPSDDWGVGLGTPGRELGPAEEDWRP